MNNNPIQTVLDYIDANINEYLSAGKLSEIANYSVPQLFRLFMSDMNTTPIKYALKRQLYYAAKELVSGDAKIIDIAYSSGFKSHDSFCRAFKRVYGVSPKLFRKKALELNEFYRRICCISGYTAPESLLKQEGENNIMSDCSDKLEMFENFIKVYGPNVEIVTVPAMKLIGVITPVGGEPYDVFCEAYDRVFRNAPNRKYPNSENITHGVPQLSPSGEPLYFVGVEVTSLDAVPDGAVSIELPEQQCAVIGFEGGLDYDTLHYYFKWWTNAQDKYKPDIRKLDSRFSEEHTWITHCPIWEYYSPNKDCDVYEERIYMPVALK